MKHVFGTVGLPGSGKSTFGEIAIEEFENTEFVSMGDIVRELADAKGLTTSDEIGEFATRMREENGRGIFAEKLIEELEFGDDVVLVIDGVRSPEEVEKLRETVSNGCTIVYIQADQETRYDRVVSRGREGEDEMSLEDFQSRDEREINWGFDEIIEQEMYDEIISNESSLESFESEIEQTIQKYI